MGDRRRISVFISVCIAATAAMASASFAFDCSSHSGKQTVTVVAVATWSNGQHGAYGCWRDLPSTPLNVVSRKALQRCTSVAKGHPCRIPHGGVLTGTTCFKIVAGGKVRATVCNR